MSVDRTPPRGIKRRGKAMELRVNQLEIDQRTQRSIRPGFVKELVADFDPDLFQDIVVSARGGKYYIIDGQHRVAALREMGWGDQLIPCLVLDDLSLAEEARLFEGYASRRQPTPYDRFRIALVGEGREETEIDKVVRSVGLSIDDQRGDKVVQCVEALRKVFRGGGIVQRESPEALARTLCLAKNAWGTGGASFQAPILVGLGLFVLRHGREIDHNSLTAELARYPGGPQGLLGRAAGLKETYRRPLAHAVAAVVVATYNAHRRGKNQLEDWWVSSKK